MLTQPRFSLYARNFIQKFRMNDTFDNNTRRYAKGYIKNMEILHLSTSFAISEKERPYLIEALQ